MQKRNILAVVGGAVVLGLAYLMTAALTLVALVLPFELADRHEAEAA